MSKINYELLQQNVRIKKNDVKESFNDRMILRAHLESTLEAQIRYINSDAYYYYDTGQRKSLVYISKLEALDAALITSLFICIAGVINNIYEHLLSINMIILEPELIYYDSIEKKFYFCIYPEKDVDKGDNFGILADFLLNVVNNDDDLAVEMVYEYYEQVEEGKYDPTPCIKKREEDYAPSQENTESEVITLNEDNEEENYYLSSQNKTEADNRKAEDTRILMRNLIICGLLIATLGSGYVYLFLNTRLLNLLGIRQEQYIVFGAGLVIGIIVAIMCIFRSYSIKRRASSGLKLC